MISSKMKAMVSNSSVIRKMFEEGKRLSQIYGEENVFDFSIGNPSVEPPEKIKEIMQKIINEEKPNILHGYMNNSGYEDWQFFEPDYDKNIFEDEVYMNMRRGIKYKRGGSEIVLSEENVDEQHVTARFFYDCLVDVEKGRIGREYLSARRYA